MSIAYIITGLGLGGAEIVTIDIANRMVQLGNKVIIIYLNGKNLLQNKIDSRIEVIGLNMHKTPLGFCEAIIKLHKIINNFDVVHSQMFHANILARIVRIFCNIPRLISTEHNKNIESKVRMKIYRLTDFLSDYNTNVSQEAVDYFIEQKAFNASKSGLVYNGIDLSRFIPSISNRYIIRNQYNIKDDDFLFINVGRLTKAKSQKDLIDAFSIIKNGKLIILGQGEMLKPLEDQVKRLHLQQKIIFAGAHSNIENYYAAADCFVLSSAWEGFGLVLAEAMACGLPVITTDAGGCREVVDNPQFVVATGDSKALANKMMQIQQMPQLEREIIGINNRNKALRFDIDKVTDIWIQIYSSSNKAIK